MVGLLYPKHAYDESDESVVARWVENPYQSPCLVVPHPAGASQRRADFAPSRESGEIT